MTQAQLDRAVASATGETIRDVRNRGFTLLEHRSESPDNDDLSLVVDCPFCGLTVPYPGRHGDDAPALAACPSCDVEFEFAQYEVYPAAMTTSP